MFGALKRWLGEPAARSEHGLERWVMLDVETSGLDPTQADLLAVAAVAVDVDWTTRRITLNLGDSFEAVIRPPKVSDKANIILHGIGQQSQLSGIEPKQALSDLYAYVGTSPLLAFHASFDKTMLSRALKFANLPAKPNVWVDIAHLCRVVQQNSSARSLDEWMQELNVHCLARHRAAADALAQSEVLMRLWPTISKQCSSFREVQQLAEQRRWLGRE